MPSIDQAKVLIIATDGFEQSELFRPREALLDAGAKVTLASIKTDPIQGMVQDTEKADTITPDITLGQVRAEEYDALVIPGGTTNPDKMRLQDEALRIVRDFFAADKTVAAICHGPWLLAEADVLEGKTVTSWPSVRTDLRNAGAEVVDKEVQVDGRLITSRKPDDIPAFTEALIKSIEAA
ncbi:type 1 glutamine amidotransferase domain-containing protein [Sphingomonas morindae]|uniref:Type 1 glutamine amidotransferase n=1 Tax=Sphingomonas morindae TaxID=1541170 RepID=A0ABY4X8W0_9SPHN|nr:type 1 glutamine amidotransferase domain-containing protein [Sphingomonas morindae]USI73381.1 type 1 glutamine amidotransferase [Sphingomonas morindae]